MHETLGAGCDLVTHWEGGGQPKCLHVTILAAFLMKFHSKKP
jgi:hypothetical protein